MAGGEGSGIIISPDGYILTNNHVVENADEIVVRLKDGRAFVGEVKGTDPDSDIAVVKIKASGLTPAKLGEFRRHARGRICAGHRRSF
jgi:S1-C subfamily serine protease